MVIRVVTLQSSRFLMAELGGCVNITLAKNGEIEFAESFRIVLARLLQMLLYTLEREQEFRTWAKYYIQGSSPL